MKELTSRDHDDGRAGSDDIVQEHVHEVDNVDKAEAIVVSHQPEQVLNNQNGVCHVREYPAASLLVVLLQVIQ